MLHYNASLDKTFFLDSVKLIEYFFSAVNVLSFNPCVEPSPRTSRRLLTTVNPFNISTLATLAKILNNFDYHHLQSDFFLENNSNQMLLIFLFYLFLLLVLFLLLMLLLFFNLIQPYL